MIIVELFNSVDIGSFLITISGKCIHEGIDLSYLWHMVRREVSLICRGTYEECPVFEKKSEYIVFTHR